MPKWVIRDDLTPAELGWVAGILDGEGCISICGRPGRRTSHGTLAMQLIVSVVNTDPRMIVKLNELFSGHIGRTSGKPRLRKRPTWTWTITGRPASRVLTHVRPYLVIKGEQADVAIAFAKTIGKGGPLSQEVETSRQSFQLQIRHLKVVGKEEPHG